MHVIAIHDISDPAKFFDVAATTPIPEGTTLHSMLPSDDGSRAVCVWEGDSLETVQSIVDDTVGDFSKNQFFEVDAQNARGLPG